MAKRKKKKERNPKKPNHESLRFCLRAYFISTLVFEKEPDAAAPRIAEDYSPRLGETCTERGVLASPFSGKEQAAGF